MDRILEYFIREPEREFYVRELSKSLKKSPTTISKYLKTYEKKGVLKSKKKFNHLLFKADNEKRPFKLTKLNYNLEKLNESGIIDYLTEKYNHPEAMVLFGSFAKAEDIPSSDIDLLIIGPAKKETDLSQYEKKLGHSIQLFVHSSKEIEKLKETNKELMNNWLNGIVVYGFWEVFR